MTVNLLEGIHRIFGTSASAIVGTDSDPLILEFVMDGLTGMKVHHANGYMELTTDTDRAPTHYVQFPACATYCTPATGPVIEHPVICQQESPPKGSPDIATAPHHASIAVGCLAFLDTDPCHCGSQDFDQTPTNDRLAYFDGYKWYSLRKGLFPGEGDFRLQNRANIVRLIVRSATVRIELTTPETGDHSWSEAPRDYRGQFNTLRDGVGRGCLIDGNSWTECHGNLRCLKGAPQAGSLVFDNIALHGGASYGPLIIMQQPQPQTISPGWVASISGRTATFTITACGLLPLTYQWQKDGVNLSDGGHVTGAAAPTLNISDAGTSDIGSYRCVVTNASGTAISKTTALSQ